MSAFDDAKTIALEREREFPEAPETASEEDVDRSLDLVRAAKDLTSEGEFFGAQKTSDGDLLVGRIAIRAFAYPHLRQRDCSLQISGMGIKLSLAELDNLASFEGEFTKSGDDPSVFGDPSEQGASSVASGDGRVITIDGAKSEGNFVNISMISYEVVAPKAH